MRIAIVSNTSWYLFNFRLTLMQALKSDGHEVIAIAPDDEYVNKLEQAGVRHHAVLITGGGTNPIIEFSSVAELYRVIKNQNIDIVFSYTPKGNLYSALACRVLGCSFVPNVSGLGRLFVKPNLASRLMLFFYRFAFGGAKKVFFQNHDDLNYFVEKKIVDISKTIRLPGSGVNLSRFTLTNDLDENRNKENKKIIFLMVARVTWDKGVGEYVEAAKKLIDKGVSAEFQLIGPLAVDNPSAVPKSEVTKWNSEGIIKYLGMTDDVRPIIQNAHCVVLPSFYREGVPRSLLEAAAMGKPIITTDHTGCRDAVIDGQTGYLCKVKDAQDLADKMIQIAELTPSDKNKMGLNGRAYIKREFDEKIVIGKYLELAGMLQKNTRVF